MKKITAALTITAAAVAIAALTGCTTQESNYDETKASIATAKAAPVHTPLEYQKISSLPNYGGTLYTFSRKDANGVTATCYFITGSSTDSTAISCYPIKDSDGQPTTEDFEPSPVATAPAK